jgi:DNA-binding beta-propeller fold protein YncE
VAGRFALRFEWRRVVCFFLVLAGVLLSLAAVRAAEKTYVVYVVCEGADRVVQVRFAGGGGRVEKEISTAAIASDISGPHGITAAPDRSAYYVTLGHGRPFGSVQKYAAEGDKLVGGVGLGNFPATLDVTPDGNFLFAVNFNLHGDMVDSSVSVVETSAMLEVARIPTCVMPHGSRINAVGTRHYSVCMMDDTLVEIDTRRMRVARYFRLTKGAEAGFVVDAEAKTSASTSVIPPAMKSDCSPTWAQPSMDDRKIYVACNKSNEIVEVDPELWRITRRFKAGNGVYNLAVSGDQRLIATNKRDTSVSVFDLTSGKEIARVPTRGTIVHGVVVSPDDRYAFVTTEGVGTASGTVERLDLRTLRMAGAVETPPQAAGIAFWKIEPSIVN